MDLVGTLRSAFSDFFGLAFPKLLNRISDWVRARTGVAIVGFVGVTIGGLIALAEVDRLIGHAVTPGSNSTIGNIVGLSAVRNVGQWDVWSAALVHSASGEVLSRLIWCHVFFDFIFYVGYVLLLWRVLAAAFDLPAGVHHGGNIAKTFLLLLLAAEIFESVCLMLAAALLNGGVGPLGWFVAAAATAKWGAIALLGITLVRNRRFRRVVVGTTRRIVPALWIQRLSMVVVVLLVALTLLPMREALDQIPDATRGFFVDAPGVGQFLVAAFAYLLASTGLFVVGRRRVQRVDAMSDVRTRRKPAAMLLWIAVPVAIAVLALTLDATGKAGLVDPFIVGVFIAIPWTVAAASIAVRWLASGEPPKISEVIGSSVLTGLLVASVGIAKGAGGSLALAMLLVVAVAVAALVAWARARTGRLELSKDDHRLSADVGFSERVRITGDVLALLVLVVAAASLIRAFTAPAAFAFATGRWQDIWTVLPVVVAGASLWLIPGWAQQQSVRLARLLSAPHWKVDYAVLLGCVVAVVGFVSFPRFVSHAGVVAVAVVGLSAWTLGLGVLIVRLQERRPPEVFGLLKMEATPVLTLTAVLLISVSINGGDPDLHRIRTKSDANVAFVRHDLREEFSQWVGRSAACERSLPGVGPRVRPMILIAASGGGIRAAVWTADSIARIADMSACGKAAAFASSGVSGGSVGLAVARLLVPQETAGPSSGVVRNAMRNLAEPSALTAGIAGTLIGDQVAAATGIRAQVEDGINKWRDRAGLMEEAWERQIPELARGYTSRVNGPTGFIVFNSTATEAKCRVLISQVELGPAHAGRGPNCRDADGAPPSAIDFANTAEGCFPHMRWSTAAMLSARFPIVTPSGRIVPAASEGECTAELLQLIDGGYAESEGLATIADIAPTLARLIRDHNSQVGNDMIVPVVAYLNDVPGVDVLPDQGKPTPELIVPLIGAGAKSQLIGSDAWIQRISNAFATEAVCPPEGECAAAVAALWEKDQHKDAHTVVTVAPPAGPELEVPLGWTLSKASLEHLEESVGPADDACTGNGDDPDPDRVISAGMTELATILCPNP